MVQSIVSPHIELQVLDLSSDSESCISKSSVMKAWFPKLYTLLNSSSRSELMKVSCFENFKDLAFLIGVV